MLPDQRPQQLHTINAIRVIAEYLVIRIHVLNPHPGDPPPHIGNDIMGFFFVLSGFVVMYSNHKIDFPTWKAKREFILPKLTRIYPIYLINWVFSVPYVLFVTIPNMNYCWAFNICLVLQFGMLDCWAGCSGRFTSNGMTWFLSCLVWLWLAFPFIKGGLVKLFQHNIWIKLAAINVIWGMAFYLLWEYDIYTLCSLPVLRLGEFIIGCGAACALRSEEGLALHSKGRHWIIVISIVTVFLIQGTPHTMDFLCLNEESQHLECTLWHAGQTRVQHKPPCLTVMDKIQNKYALLWAVFIHGVAKTELRNEGNPGWASRVLRADLFQCISRVSLTIYVSHVNLGAAVRWVGEKLLQWDQGKWRDDTLLLAIYLACYGLHQLMVKIMAWRSQKPYSAVPSEPQEENT
jgi:peptidoglycan/LPS O-acetylase OafA/YrhL